MSLVALNTLSLVGRPSLDDGPDDTTRVRAKLRWLIGSPEDAEELHGIFPALRSYYLRATNTDAPASPFRLIWTADEEPASIVIGEQQTFGGSAVVLRAQATLSQKAAHVDLWVRWDVEAEQLPALAAMLRVVGVAASVDPAQLRMPFAELKASAA